MKHVFTIFLFALMSSGLAQIPNYVPTEDLISWHPLDGTATDVSGNGHHGSMTLLEGAVNRFGIESSALFFDSGSNGFVEIPSLNDSPYYPITYALWTKASQLPISDGFNFSALVGRNKPNVVSCGALGVFWNNELGVWRGGLFDGDPPAYSLPDSIFSEWRHVAYTMDENQSWTMHIDGVLVAQGTAIGTMDYFGSFRIGSVENDDGDGDLSWDGWIDDVGIWSRVLTTEEILMLSQAPPPVLGCTDESACNFDQDANADDGTCELSGCTDAFACNFDSIAVCDNGGCDYSCCPGPGCCDVGMHWDWELGMCQITKGADINLDGCVQLGDLLDLLAAYGDCAAAESAWQCGDPLEYQGYDYKTVQIGEQCWFAENLRSEFYVNGDVILGDLNGQEWVGTGYVGAQAVFENDENYLPSFGRLYNYSAAIDERGLCPTGWHVPADSEFGLLSDFAGGGSVAGNALKAQEVWPTYGVGENLLGFEALPGGSYADSGIFAGLLEYGRFWSSTPVHSNAAWGWQVNVSDEFGHYDNGKGNGFSIRCLKDSE